MDAHESIDVYSMANNIYCILTGLHPYYQYSEKNPPNNNNAIRRIQHIIEHRIEHPYVDPRYRTRSAIEAGLVEIMERMWTWDMDERPTIFDVARELHQLRRQNHHIEKRRKKVCIINESTNETHCMMPHVTANAKV